MARRQQERKAQTRAELLDATAELFAERGFQRVTMEQIAERAGFTTGAIYRHFESKQDLFLSLFEDRIERRMRAIEQAAPPEIGPEAGLEGAGRQFAELLRRDRGWYLLLFEYWLEAARDPAFRKRFRRRHERSHAALSKLIDGLAVQLPAPLALPSTDLATIVIAVSYGFALERLLGSMRAPELAAQTISDIMHAAGFGAAPEGDRRSD
jgi:AcrR family transcriptional regulator